MLHRDVTKLAPIAIMLSSSLLYPKNGIFITYLPLQARSALHDFHEMGSRRIRLKFLDLYPSDAILETKLGPTIWDMFRSTETKYSDISVAKAVQKEEEIRQLNVAAKEFVPSFSPSQGSYLDESGYLAHDAGYEEHTAEPPSQDLVGLAVPCELFLLLAEG